MINNWRQKMGMELKIVRIRAGLTQEKLANELNCHPRQVYKWEKGERPIPLKYLIQLPFILGCRIDDINPIKVNQPN